MKTKVSLKDVANKVGVSTALVSYVLNNKMQGRISKEMAVRIREAAEELNYRPNQVARSLKMARTSSIGLLLADISNPFSAQIARIVENEANRHGYTVIIGSSDENADKTRSLIQLFLNRQLDGLILLLPEHTEDQIEMLQKHQVPFVLLDRYFSQYQTNVVALDNAAASATAIRHLMEQGHSSIGVVSYQTELEHLQDRLQGAIDLMDDKSLVGEIRIDHIDEDVAASIDRFMNNENPVDALFFTSNLLTISGLKHLNKLGVKVPDELAVVGFDKTDAFELFYTTVSYINQPLTELGENAVRLLLKTIDDKDHLEQLKLDANLVILQSSK